MANNPIFLTVDEAASLQAAVESIVSTGIKVQDAEYPIPAARTSGDGADGLSAGKLEVPPESGL